MQAQEHHIPKFPEPEWFAEQIYCTEKQLKALLDMAAAFKIVVPPLTRLGPTQREAAYQTLKAAGRPMHITEIICDMRSRGAAPGGRRPQNTLHATLGQDRRVKRVGVNLWDLDPAYAPAPAKSPHTKGGA